MLCLNKKRHIKGEKHITPMDFNFQWTFKRIAKFIMVNLYEMDFMKGVGSKGRSDVQYLKVC